MRLTVIQKQAITRDYCAGLSVGALCQGHTISESAFYRLKREDRTFQEAVGAFSAELSEHLRHSLRQRADRAIAVLEEIMQTSAENFEAGTGPAGGAVIIRKKDPKILSERRLSAMALVDFWLKLRAHDEDTRRWQMLNVGYPSDDDEEEEDGDEEDDDWSCNG